MDWVTSVAGSGMVTQNGTLAPKTEEEKLSDTVREIQEGENSSI